jgi:hypothetical protein
MTPHDPDLVPDDLHEVDRRLRAHRSEVGRPELDSLKLRTAARAFRAPASLYGRPNLMRSKLVTMLLVLGVLGGGAAGVVASHDNGNGKSADKGEYRPGKGCGDKNHIHERENECKKPPR